MTDTIPAMRIGAIAEQTGLAEATLRAWERRYGIPTPQRTAGGHRLYDASEVARIRRVQDLIAQGYTTHRAAGVVRERVPSATTAEGLLLDLVTARDLAAEARLAGAPHAVQHARNQALDAAYARASAFLQAVS